MVEFVYEISQIRNKLHTRTESRPINTAIYNKRQLHIVFSTLGKHW